MLGLAFAARFDPALSVQALALVGKTPGAVACDRACVLLQNINEFMDRSLFEGGGFGAGDLPILIQIGAFLLYGTSFARSAPAAVRRHRGTFAYVWISAVITAAGVHLFKGLVARPRPYEVAQGAVTFHAWFDLHMPHFFAFGRGSFPSGHTAGAATLWALVMIARQRYPKRWIGNTLLAAGCFVFTVAMAFSRVAHGDHWPTDTLAAMVLAVLVAWRVGQVMLPTATHLSKGRGDAERVWWHLRVLFWWCALWLTMGVFYLAVKLSLTGAPLLGTAAFLASFGGGYGVGLARARCWGI